VEVSLKESALYFTLANLLTAHTALTIISAMTVNLVLITLFVTGFLCLLNLGLAIVFRKNSRRELLSYYVVCVGELAIFLFALLFHLGVIAHVPYHLPPGLPFDRAEIGATLAIGLGLFPAGYWHRMTFSELGTRMAEDAKTIRERDGGVRIRENGPGAWMN
jgi:hypothetical protein